MAITVSPNRLRAARARAGKHQEEAALDSGVTCQTIVALEAGYRTPSLRLLLALAECYGVSVDSLLDREHSRRAAS